jgi:hypothetical protein
VYSRLGQRKVASNYLKEIGIPGIKYLDQGSRTPAAAEVYKSTMGNSWYIKNGPATAFPSQQAALKAAEELNPKTRNYVVFDDTLVRIIRKYVLAGMGVSAAIERAQAERQVGQPPPSASTRAQ